MRMSGHNYNEPKSVNIEEMPKGLKQIRKYLRTNNLNPKNDLYYYREKNNIEVKIPCSEIDVLGSAYNVFINQGGKMSPKDYIYHKLKNVDKYKELLLFVKKKTQED